MRIWYTALVVLLLVNTVGLGLLYHRLDTLAQLFPFAMLQDSINTQKDISTKLTSLQNLIGQANSNNPNSSVLGLADLLPDKPNTATTSSTNTISVKKDQTTPVSVYKEQAEFSAVLGQLIPDYKYPYFSKSDGWYLVSLASGKSGWVKAVSVFENP